MGRETLRKRLSILIKLSRLQRLQSLRKNKGKRARRCWVRDIFKNRDRYGVFSTLFEELKNDREYFFRYLRMSPDRFKHLLDLIRPGIEKSDTKFRKSISAEERLALTIRFLASGESQQSLSYSFRIGKATVCQIVSETCDAIYNSLKADYMKVPQTPEEWQAVSKRFDEVWNFPHAIGAIDGKHIRIQCPKLTGTLYHNYKGFFSIVLLAVCDADYCFTLFDLGSYGSNNDSGILANSSLGQRFEDSEMNLPPAENLLGCSFEPLPYFLLGDEIFPLKQWLIRPFPGSSFTEEQRVYNYRHSRCRRVIENAFGILVARWRILSTPIRASVQHVEEYVLACLALHNYLRKTNNASYTPTGFVDSENSDGTLRHGDWRTEIHTFDNGPNCMRNIRPIRGSRPRDECVQMRDAIKDFLNSEEGSVPWQMTYVRRTYRK